MPNDKSPNYPVTIIDLGAHNGTDIQYYLNKADLVVAVEANPEMCEIIRKNHPEELSTGALVVENCVVTTNDDYRDEGVDFFIHNEHTYLSQLEEPKSNRRMLYTKHRLQCRSIEDLDTLKNRL